jgi:hypothetical protein
MYGSGTGLKCHGDGEKARRLDDKGEWQDHKCPCEFLKTDENPKGACTEQSSLMVLLPKVSMGGCYQITTGSFHSTKTLNSALDYIRGLAGRLALIPMRLRRVPRVTHNGGKPQTHHTLELILDGDLKMIRELRADAEGSLIPTRYRIEAPLDENKTLDPVDEVEDDDDGIDAEKLAEMDNAELDKVQMALAEKAKKAQGDGRPTQALQTKPSPATSNQDAPAPKPTEPVLIPMESWNSILFEIDGSPELNALKKEWKTDNNVTNVTFLKAEGQRLLMNYIRENASKLSIKVTF